MISVIQRVLSASVSIKGKQISSINKGILVFLGVEKDDSLEDLDYLVKKTVGLRIFNDEKNNMNFSIKEIGGEALVVSQFTLCANTKKGRRPSFINAAPNNTANFMYQHFCKQLIEKNISTCNGQFGATMAVELINDGPVTIILDSNDK